MTPLDIEIFNQKLKIQSDLPSSKAEDVSIIVQRLIKEVELRKKFKSTQDILLIALLELAHEYINSKQRVSDFQKNLFHKLDEIDKDIKKNSFS